MSEAPEVPLPEEFAALQAEVSSLDPTMRADFMLALAELFGVDLAARAVEQERARVVALVSAHTPEYARVIEYVRCGDCSDDREYSEHLTDLIERGEHEQASDA